MVIAKKLKTCVKSTKGTKSKPSKNEIHTDYAFSKRAIDSMPNSFKLGFDPFNVILKVLTKEQIWHSDLFKNNNM